MAKDRNPDPRRAGARPPYPKQQQETPGSEAGMRPRPDFGERSYRGHGRLQDRVAIVTGADSGIGRAVALAFAREGAHVVVSYLSEHEDAEETRRAVEAAGRTALLVAGDLAEDAQCARVVAAAIERFGRLDVLVNNAAFQGRAVERFEDLDAERVERTFRTNVVAMFNLTRHALPHLKPGAAIVNTTSIQAYHPNPQILDYAATKGAIRTFTQGLSKELAARGIRVNGVAPGPIWTPLIPQSFPDEKVEKHGESAPMERAGQPAEVAPVFVFLASDDARYVSGEIVGVTGGSPLA
ncbi:glucose 1-dehydrogenase [Anaeromyxobacter sp. Red801]|uniref:glucose 1-dehydrogenase n=1 Tax=Anaeromyxobacter sp. Red801 TaxID=3411632 RepID=UPI003B9E4267